jgi:hypothetical protein
MSPLSTIALMPTEVASEKKLHREMPRSKTIGKVGVPSVNFRNLTNTVYMTRNSASGLSTDQSMPSIDP